MREWFNDSCVVDLSRSDFWNSNWTTLTGHWICETTYVTIRLIGRFMCETKVSDSREKLIEDLWNRVRVIIRLTINSETDIFGVGWHKQLSVVTKVILWEKADKQRPYFAWNISFIQLINKIMVSKHAASNVFLKASKSTHERYPLSAKTWWCQCCEEYRKWIAKHPSPTRTFVNDQPTNIYIFPDKT